jgi:hypothetical protein
MNTNTLKLSGTPQNTMSSLNQSTNVDDGKSFGIVTWIVIISILSLLGFAVFVYLAKGVNIFKNFLEKIKGLIKPKEDVPPEPEKTDSNSLQNDQINSSQDDDHITSTQDDDENSEQPHTFNRKRLIERRVEANDDPSRNHINERKTRVEDYNTATTPYGHDNATINNALKSTQEQPPLKNGEDYEAHEARSSFQENKSGWCFIGEDGGNRSCSSVGLNDNCMSGEIFPSKDVCINPNLRV